MAMTLTKHQKLIIIGSGPAGYSAGIYAARARLVPLIMQGKKPGGQLVGTSCVTNWPGEISILGPDLMNKIQDHAVRAGCELLAEVVVKTDFSKRPYVVWTHRGKEFTADVVIIATGSLPRTLDCPGQEEYWGKGVSTCAVCDSALYQGKDVVIVGGGDTAMEHLSALAKYAKGITIVHILDKLTATPELQQRVNEYPGVDVVYRSTVTEIHGANGHVTGVTITNQVTNEKTHLPTSGIFLAIGLTPNTMSVKDQVELDQAGYIKVFNGTTQTSRPGVFAAGDVVDWRYRQAITAAGSGCMAALDAERYLASRPIVAD